MYMYNIAHLILCKIYELILLLQNFQKGQINSFLLKTNADLGELMTMAIWHDSSGQGDQNGWFLEKVVVVDKHRGQWLV